MFESNNILNEVSVDTSILYEYLEKYKKNFSDIFEINRYKWDVIRCFQRSWDIDANNFDEMFLNTVSQITNILPEYNDYFIENICQMVQNIPDEVRDLFVDVFDEKIDLLLRIENCKKKSGILYKLLHKRERPFITKDIINFLVLRYPNKYFPYRFFDYLNVAKEIKYSRKFEKGLLKNNFENVYALHSIILEKISNDKPLIALLDSQLNDDSYNEYKLNILAIDFIDFIIKNLEIDNESYFPSLYEYDPAITSSEYKRLLIDKNVVNPKWFDVLLYMYQMGGKATCLQISKKYGDSPQHYKANAIHISEAILKNTNCPLYDDPKFGGPWCILFYGKNAEAHEGSFKWKLREPLFEAISELVEEGRLKMSFDNNKELNNLYPLNTILYGPPGTGKTYCAVLYAVAICENADIAALLKEKYSDVYDRFCKLKKQGRIAFTTFHQSYGYEEFIEGFKPSVNETNDISYVLENGVFKDFCEKATAFDYEKINFNASVFVVRLNGKGDNDLKSACFRDGEIRFDWDKDNPDEWIKWLRDMKSGDYVISYARESRIIDGVGIVKDEEPVYDDSKSSFCWKRNVEWISYGKEMDVMPINGGKCLSNFHVGRVPNMKVSSLLSLLNEDNEKKYDFSKPHVFIIDEINRGNISKIFGELITLIEDSKRLGKKESFEALLPYSHQLFGIPKNVYILGTMNTADRSIALMDTALRRRFSFVEMMPDSDVLRNKNINIIESDGEIIDIANMLDVINERIEYLYDREHTIGHALFMKLEEDQSITKLSEIFENKVIPLLQEYFYDDYKKIQFVLGDNAKIDDEYKFILDRTIKAENIFKGDISELDLPEKKFVIQKSAFKKIQSYKQIADNL